MKYKLEFWPYGEFETEEAAERLNQRASEGWELVNIDAQICSVALYRRNPAAMGYRYTADIVPATEGHDEEYVSFCADAGWEKIAAMNSGFCIFVSKDGSARPLHTNKQVQFERQLQVLAENHVSVSVLPYVLEIVFVGAIWFCTFYFSISHTFGNWILWVCPIYIIIAIRQPLVYGVNLAYIKRARRSCEEGEIIQRPKWLAGLYAALSASTEIFCTIAWIYFLVLEITEGTWPLPVIAALNSLSLILGASGMWQKLFQRRCDVGNGLIFLAIIFLMAPILAI